MKPIFISLFLLLLCSWQIQGQDYIFKKDNTIQKAKILEITTEKIKFKKSEVPNGPTYEILLSEVLKIRYSNGYTDWLNNSKYDTTANKDNSTIVESSHKQTKGFKKFTDTLSYAMIYILFNSGQDASQKIPLYFNGVYVATIKNHMRLTYKMYSEGFLLVERKGSKNSKDEPATSMHISRGQSYGIDIEEPYPWALKPNKKFTFTALTEEPDVSAFLSSDFYGFEPFPVNDIKLTETKDVP